MTKSPLHDEANMHDAIYYDLCNEVYIRILIQFQVFYCIPTLLI